jgi:hypothetical protein
LCFAACSATQVGSIAWAWRALSSGNKKGRLITADGGGGGGGAADSHLLERRIMRRLCACVGVWLLTWSVPLIIILVRRRWQPAPPPAATPQCRRLPA